MSRPKVAYSPAAVRDLDEILAYIARDNPAAAAGIAAKIRESIGLLGTFPLMGRLLQAPGLGGHRALVVGDYLVFYAVEHDEVQVRRVIHGARRYEFLLEPTDDLLVHE